jgi:predicted lactoylglutathione lyase
MSTKIFLNLPVKDLSRSMDFFKGLGYTFNMQFTDEKAACMIISQDIYTMLLTEPFFKTFIKKDICDSSKYTEAITCLSAENRAAVDQLVDKALSLGAVAYSEPQDHGFMYSRAFEDLDGHLWEIMYMDPTAVQG